jgi:GxxExxY protein
VDTEDTEDHRGHGEASRPVPGTDLSRRIIGAAIAVHRELGPGLLEAIYEECLCLELARAGLAFDRQMAVGVLYKGDPIAVGLRLDIVVEGAAVVEVKSVEQLSPVHEAQVLSYLRIGGYRIGLLLNFNVVRMTDGIRRLVR